MLCSMVSIRVVEMTEKSYQDGSDLAYLQGKIEGLGEFMDITEEDLK